MDSLASRLSRTILRVEEELEAEASPDVEISLSPPIPPSRHVPNANLVTDDSEDMSTPMIGSSPLRVNENRRSVLTAIPANHQIVPLLPHQGEMSAEYLNKCDRRSVLVAQTVRPPPLPNLLDGTRVVGLDDSARTVIKRHQPDGFPKGKHFGFVEHNGMVPQNISKSPQEMTLYLDRRHNWAGVITRNGVSKTLNHKSHILKYLNSSFQGDTFTMVKADFLNQFCKQKVNLKRVIENKEGHERSKRRS
jgi:hypothetical protein